MPNIKENLIRDVKSYLKRENHVFCRSLKSAWDHAQTIVRVKHYIIFLKISSVGSISRGQIMFLFFIGLKPMPKDASRRELSKSVLRIEKGALCAELRPFYCSIRMLVPISYVFRGVNSWNTRGKNVVKTKRMRLDPLIKTRIEWNPYELILRGKQLKYWGAEMR